MGLAALVILTLLAVPHGLEAVMFALLVQQLLMWGLTGWGVAKIIGFPVSRQLLAGTGALAAALVMAAVVTGLGYLLSANWNDGLRLGLLILAGGVSYVIALAVISQKAASRIFRAARAAARGNRSAAVAIFRGQDPGDPVA